MLSSAVFFIVSALVLVWDVGIAGENARLPRAPRAFAYLSAFCGLLILPATLVAFASGSLLTGRAMYAIAWLWPLTLALFAGQALYAWTRRLAAPGFALAIVGYNVLIALAAISRSLASFDDVLGEVVLVPVAARASELGLVFGRAALGSPLALLVPMLVPMNPARSRVMRLTRTALATLGVVTSCIIVLELPPASRAVTTYAAFDAERLQERPAGDFALGLWILPALDAPPPPLALTYDMQLIDSLAPDAIAVEVTPNGTRSGALDSLGRALDDLRRDSIVLIVSLGYDRHDRERYAASPDDYALARVRAIDRIVRTLRPDYLLPAREPYEAGIRALGDVPVAWWTTYLARAADTARVLRPRTLVAVDAASFTASDSVLYHWAAGASSGIDVLGFAFVPSYAGAAALQARMRAADRWMRNAPNKEHWIFAAGETPGTHGERNQARALWGTLAWATSRARIRGVLVRSAGDYDAINGIRAPGGRLRPVADVLRRARILLAESRALGREP